MKQILIILLSLFPVLSSVKAQDVFLEIRNTALDATLSPTNNDIIKQVNQFKVDALDYMLTKMREQMPDSTTSFLDKQALAMNSFVTYYIQSIVESNSLPAAMQLKITELFMDASYSNPLFNDQDKELVLSYFADGKCITRFSLDTDWRRANVCVYLEMEKIKKDFKQPQP